MKDSYEFLLFPNNRNWFAIVLLFAGSALWFLGSFSLFQYVGTALVIGISWNLIGLLIFRKGAQKLLGSEKVIIDEQKITYSWMPLGLPKKFYKSEINHLKLTAPYRTDDENRGANFLGVTPWEINLSIGKKSKSLGRYLTKEQGEMIMTKLSELGYNLDLSLEN